MAEKKTAADRWEGAKRAVVRHERERETFEVQWGECLLNDDERGVARCERQIDAVARKLKRARFLVERLPLQVQREQSEADNPSTAAACEQKLFEMERELAQLRAGKRAGPVSAGHDARIDTLVSRIGAMKKRIAFLEKFEAANRGEAA